MKKIIYFLIALGFLIGITIGSSTNVIAQQASIPSWVKHNALWWGQGQISDDEFIKALQWLIDNSLIKLPSQQPSQTNQTPNPDDITNTSCHRDETVPNIIHMTGKFTNGPIPYSLVYLQLGIIDANGTVVATGSATIDNIAAYQTKIFDAEAIYSEQFGKCEIEISTTLP